MSRNQRARRKDKHIKKQGQARLPSPSKSAIWTQACDHADDLIGQEKWSEAREVLEAVDRLHPGAICVLDRLADVYEELGETDCLASIRARRKSNPLLSETARRFLDVQSRLQNNQLSDVAPELCEIVTLNFKIDYNPVEVTRSPQVMDWAERGYDALQRRKGQEAEILFKKCLEAGEDAPDLLNNLAAAYAMQGRHKESHELAHTIHARWPEYFFGRIFMANTATMEGRFEDAENYLRSMVTQERFHITEFRAMATAYIQLKIEQRMLSAAQSWVDLWKSIEQDDRDLEMLEQRIKISSLPDRLLNWLTSLRR